jgi:hypothetical protein
MKLSGIRQLRLIGAERHRRNLDGMPEGKP